MGIVAQQSFKNTLIIFLGFAIGGINVLFLYTHFLEADYFGLVTFLLSAANIVMPLLVFGMQHTIIKFFTSYKNKTERDNFLITAIFLPLLIIIPLAFLSTFFYNFIAESLSRENIIIKKYTYLIFIIAIFMGYFEVFYAWSKVQMKSVFGNFIREVFARVCVMGLLFLLHFGVINSDQFIYALVVVYFLRLVIIKLYAYSLYFPSFQKFSLPKNIKEILSFSFYIILAGSAGSILLEIDKFMIPQLEKIAQVAYYSVGVYIASVIAIPSRAMQQIINPITAKELNDNNIKEVGFLYKKSSDMLLIGGGLLFLLINLNIQDVYQIIDKPEYMVGIPIVLIISLSELFKLSLGTNGAILTNSKYYKVFFYLSIAMAVSVIVLNRIMIEYFGINGAALATFLVVVIFGIIKIIYIQYKMQLQPYSANSLKIVGLILLLYIVFSFISFGLSPYLNVIIKSVLITAIFGLVIVKLQLSHEINRLVKKYF